MPTPQQRRGWFQAKGEEKVHHYSLMRGRRFESTCGRDFPAHECAPAVYDDHQDQICLHCYLLIDETQD